MPLVLLSRKPVAMVLRLRKQGVYTTLRLLRGLRTLVGAERLIAVSFNSINNSSSVNRFMLFQARSAMASEGLGADLKPGTYSGRLW